MIKAEELLKRVEQDAVNKLDIIPLMTEIQFETTDTINTFDRLVLNMPGGRRYCHFKGESRRRFIQSLQGPEPYFVKICDTAMRQANMEYLLGRYGEKHDKMLLRCRDRSAGMNGVPEDLVIRSAHDSSWLKFDDAEFIRAMLEPLTNHDMEIGEPIIDDDQLQVRAYFPESDVIDVAKHHFRPGMMIINSETGCHKPRVECIMENTTNSSIIRWPVDNGSLLEINRSMVHAANLAKQVETLPGTAYEQIDAMTTALKKASATAYRGEVSLQLYTLIHGAKINDDGRYLQEMMKHIDMSTGSGARQITRLDMVQAVARVAYNHQQQRFANLAGNMLVNDAAWSNQIENLLSKKDKAGAGAQQEEEEVEV